MSSRNALPCLPHDAHGLRNEAAKRFWLLNYLALHFSHLFFQTISEAQAVISKCRNRLKTAEQELTEIRRREANDRALKLKADGVPFVAQIRDTHRYDWTQRYNTAMAAAEDSEEVLEVSSFHLMEGRLIRSTSLLVPLFSEAKILEYFRSTNGSRINSSPPWTRPLNLTLHRNQPSIISNCRRKLSRPSPWTYL